MVKWIPFILIVFLMGCTNHLLIRNSIDYRGDYHEVANSIYKMAKTCWTQEETFLKAQVLVENVVTLDSIIVSARFDSFGAAVQNPFIKFVIKPDSNGDTKIDLYFQEIDWIGKERHLKDAYNWMNGNYFCSQ